MVSLRKGILRINFGSESKARQVYEFAFLLNIVVIFAFYRVPIVAPATAVFMLLLLSLCSWRAERTEL